MDKIYLELAQHLTRELKYPVSVEDFRIFGRGGKNLYESGYIISDDLNFMMNSSFFTEYDQFKDSITSFETKHLSLITNLDISRDD